jgi:hypothetical protein
MLRDRIEFYDRELVIQGMAGERITRIGLPLEPRERMIAGGSSLAAC